MPDRFIIFGGCFYLVHSPFFAQFISSIQRCTLLSLSHPLRRWLCLISFQTGPQQKQYEHTHTYTQLLYLPSPNVKMRRAKYKFTIEKQKPAKRVWRWLIDCTDWCGGKLATEMQSIPGARECDYRCNGKRSKLKAFHWSISSNCALSKWVSEK